MTNCFYHVLAVISTLRNGYWFSKLRRALRGVCLEQFMTEVVCPSCSLTSHITWEGSGAAKKVAELSQNLREHEETPPQYTCVGCGVPLVVSQP